MRLLAPFFRRVYLENVRVDAGVEVNVGPEQSAQADTSGHHWPMPIGFQPNVYTALD